MDEQENNQNQENISEDLSSKEPKKVGMESRRDPNRFYYLVAVVVILLILTALLFILIDREEEEVRRGLTEQERQEVMDRLKTEGQQVSDEERDQFRDRFRQRSQESNQE